MRRLGLLSCVVLALLITGCSSGASQLTQQQAAARYLTIVAPSNAAASDFKAAVSTPSLQMDTIHQTALALADAEHQFTTDLLHTEWPDTVADTAKALASQVAAGQQWLDRIAQATTFDEVQADLSSLQLALSTSNATAELMRATLGLPPVPFLTSVPTAAS